MSANFEIIETFDGYYVKVTGKVDLNLLSQELKRQRLEVDISKIMREIVNAKVGQEILVFSKPAEPEGKIVLTIAPGRMSALLTLNIKPGEKVPLDEVFQKLKDKQIVHGVNLERIKTLVNLKRPAFREVIAAGDSPEPGLDARIDYTHGQPAINPFPAEDGYSYKPGSIKLVRQGEVLAQRTPSTLGVFGCNVLGEIVHPPPGRNLDFKVNDGVTVQGNTAVAARDGAVVWEDSGIGVVDVKTIPEDLPRGAISADGMVLVLGNVGSGARIQAQGDIEVRGSIEEATLVSIDGSIFVEGGIIGRGETSIKAAGNVEAQFIQEAAVEAGHNIIVDNYIQDSLITVGQAVYFKTIKEFTPPGKNSIKSNVIDQSEIVVSTADLAQPYPERVKQITKDMKGIEREMKSFTSRFKSLTGREDSRIELQEQLAGYSNLTDKLDQFKQERQALVNRWGGKGLGLLGLLVNIGICFRVRYEQLLLEQPVKQATMFYDYHKKQAAFSGNQSPPQPGL